MLFENSIYMCEMSSNNNKKTQRSKTQNNNLVNLFCDRSTISQPHYCTLERKCERRLLIKSIPAANRVGGFRTHLTVYQNPVGHSRTTKPLTWIVRE